METHGQWRLLTRRDFSALLEEWKPQADTVFGWDHEVPAGGRVNATQLETRQSINRLREHIEGGIEYEHGSDRKTPRANVYRPYRFTLDGILVAALCFRASEAFHVCEIDVFLTADLPGLGALETTRAALMFCLSDAAKNGGSMALHFTRPCCGGEVPPHVRAVADDLGVTLESAERGAISPEEGRELFIRLSGLSAKAIERARALSRRGFFSLERIALFTATGTWSRSETEMVLLACPFPELLFGEGAWAEHRHLHAHALAHGRAAVMSGCFDRALRYCEPTLTQNGRAIEDQLYLDLPNEPVPEHYAFLHGPVNAERELQSWAPHEDAGPRLLPKQALLILPRPRAREEIRLFLRQDLESAAAARQAHEPVRAILVYTSEWFELSSSERKEACKAADRRRVEIMVCPQNLSALDAEVDRRMAAGRRMRR